MAANLAAQHAHVEVTKENSCQEQVDGRDGCGYAAAPALRDRPSGGERSPVGHNGLARAVAQGGGSGAVEGTQR